MIADLDVGDVIFINDGIIKLRVIRKLEKSLKCVCEAGKWLTFSLYSHLGGMISDHKGCNIPSGNISLNVITPKDERDLKLIAELDPEYVACSFIGTADDVRKVRKMLNEFGNNRIKIISKIERPVALRMLSSVGKAYISENIDAIIEETDGIMVARGDLGVEIDTWDVPTAQKMMCKKCNKAGKPVIVATQMLESMISAPRPVHPLPGTATHLL